MYIFAQNMAIIVWKSYWLQIESSFCKHYHSSYSSYFVYRIVILSTLFTWKRKQFRRLFSSVSKVYIYLLNIGIISSLTFCYITKLIGKKIVLLGIYFFSFILAKQPWYGWSFFRYLFISFWEKSLLCFGINFYQNSILIRYNFI